MRRAYKQKRFSAASEDLVVAMDAITTKYHDDGLSLTLRQLYYRLVATGQIPNTEKSYARVGRVLSDARLAGRIDWQVIVDRERSPRYWETWKSPGDALADSAGKLRYDHWRDQKVAVEVWVEKKALISVVARACAPYRALHFACKGYVSQSAMHEAAQRIFYRRVAARAQPTVILYLGDHDPSGLDMPRDIRDRLAMFGERPGLCSIALTRAQIDAHAPPPNPAKITDSRFGAYQREHGDYSWELDALEPATLIHIISKSIETAIDMDVLRATKDREQRDRARLLQFADEFDG